MVHPLRWFLVGVLYVFRKLVGWIVDLLPGLVLYMLLFVNVEFCNNQVDFHAFY